MTVWLDSVPVAICSLATISYLILFFNSQDKKLFLETSNTFIQSSGMTVVSLLQSSGTTVVYLLQSSGMTVVSLLDITSKFLFQVLKFKIANDCILFELYS